MREIDWFGVVVPATPWDPSKYILELKGLGVIRAKWAPELPRNKRWTGQLLYPGSSLVAHGSEGWRALEVCFLAAKGEANEIERKHAAPLLEWIERNRLLYRAQVIERLHEASQKCDLTTTVHLLKQAQARMNVEIEARTEET